jgi:hypothetical protein
MFNGMPLNLPLYSVFLQGRRADPAMTWFIAHLRTRLVDFRDFFIQPSDEAGAVPYPYLR